MTRSMSSVQGVKGSRLAGQADDREFNGEKEPQWIQEVKLGNVQGDAGSYIPRGTMRDRGTGPVTTGAGNKLWY